MLVEPTGATHRRLGLLATLAAAVYFVSYSWPAAAQLGPLRNLLATLVASLPYATAVYLGLRRGLPAGRGGLWLLLAGALAMRLMLPPELLVGSDDAYRYLWDGKVLDHGINPYSLAPADAGLAALRGHTFYPHIFRPEMRTVYPPLAQLWFWVSYRLCPDGFWGLKLVLLLHELASVALLWLLLRRSGQPPARALVYAWSPLAVVQLFAAGHLDGMLTPWLLLAVLLEQRGQHPLAAGASLGAAAMVRPLALLGAPALLGARGLRGAAGQRWALGCGLGLSGSLVALVAPFAAARQGLWESLLIYAGNWRFNGSIFPLMERLLGHRHWLRPATYTAVGAASLLPVLLRLPLHLGLMLAQGAYLAFSPTVYPWYLLPLQALAALWRVGPWSVALPLLVTLSDLVFLNEVIAGAWRVPQGAWVLEYALIYGLLLWQLTARAGRGQHDGV